MASIYSLYSKEQLIQSLELRDEFIKAQDKLAIAQDKLKSILEQKIMLLEKEREAIYATLDKHINFLRNKDLTHG